MSTVRRTIEKIAPREPSGIDTPFWPVVISLGMTASLAAGAVVSLMRGPWMWGSLLMLPLLVAATLFCLQRLPQGLLKRSLQVAIIGSLAVHLLILILAASTEIFRGTVRQQMVRNAPQKSTRVLIVQRQQNPLVWQQMEQQPPVETTRENERAETVEKVERPEVRDVTPQPDRAESLREPTPRRQPANPPPKLGESPSEARRSEAAELPFSGGQRVAATESQPTRSARPQPASASAAMDRSVTANERLAPRATASDALPRSSERPAATSTRRTEAGESSLDARPALTTARLREPQPQVTRLSRNDSLTHSTSGTSASTKPESKEATASLERSSRSGDATSRSGPTPAASDLATRSTADSPPRADRAERPQTPSLVQNDSQPVQPRRSRAEALQPRSPTALESIAVSSTRSAESAPREPQWSPASPTKAVGEGAFAAQSRNLVAESLPATGMAANPTNAAQRREAIAKPELAESLTTQQATHAERTAARNPLSASANRVNTERSASLTGSRSPQRESTESSAARQDSSMATRRASEIAAEVGASQLDTGPVKTVEANQVTQASADGGGQPELGTLETQPQDRPERSQSGQAPALASMTPSDVPAAPRAPGAPEMEARRPSETALAQEQTAASNSREGPVRDTRARETGSLSQDDSQATNATPMASRREEDEEGEQSGALAAAEPETSTRTGNQPRGLSRAALSRPEIRLADSSGQSELGGLGRESLLPRTSMGEPAGRLMASERPDSVPDRPGVESSSSADSGAALVTRITSDDRVQETLSGKEPIASHGRAPSTVSPSLSTEVRLSEPGANREIVRVGETEMQSQVLSERMAGSLSRASSDPLGPSGIGNRPSLETGVPERPAQRDSLTLLSNEPDRFVRESAAMARPNTRTDAVAATEAFRERMPELGGGGPSTEASIELGLQFLARFQRPDGSWALEDFDRGHPYHRERLQSDAAATGLALLAFQGAGYSHREYKYALPLTRAVDWLVEHQDSDGCLYVSSDARSDQSCRMYSHAIATLALTEAYGMTQDPRLQEPCQRALDYIANTQDPERGGWRYYAELAMRRTDTSVTGWMMMAMQSGRLAGLETSQETWSGIRAWLDLSRDGREEGRFRYDPFAPANQPVQRQVTPPMTAVGLLMRLYSGWNRDDERLQRGASFLMQSLPGESSSEERDTYYWYYATQVLRHVGGSAWTTWNARLHPLLVDSQVKSGELAGSWDPYFPVPDRWGRAAGRLYVTTMNLLSLEVDYRLLPLYEETVR